ncbi:diguanylate cyclase (GGDEF) domain-containing protein [Anaerocolumna jejuensis DSM 15929]|uniref:Diguanylate cyclase (GGDEF) domain-containing protein n=1 Tax=Anaerocolumna jejuensis DSM 15929 TaxID=1121322 RepID=A0A1M6PMM8_9FIRM|nr:tetratricopeptide repeat-containing diguanylate cyclase [Anaerocolumna jejuensis]SHK09173.1 diguanylate cyclase (GGDEF) domain-containing protein [Anaerocolumna jejuensis DSM 15929]
MIGTIGEVDRIFYRSLEELESHHLDEAIKSCMEALCGYEELGEYFKSARCQNLQGVIYAAMDNETMAVDCYLAGLEYCRKHQVKGLAHLFYCNIGTRYLELGDTAKAIDFFLKGLADLTENGNDLSDLYEKWLIVNKLNLGVAYLRFGRLEEAEENLKAAMELVESTGDNTYSFTIMCGLSKIYLAKDEEGYVRENLHTMMEYVRLKLAPLNDYMQDIISFIDILKAIGEFDLWRETIEEFDQLSREVKSPTVMLQAVEFWLDYYSTRGMMEEHKRMCIRHTQLYMALKKYINQDKIMALNAKLELQQAEDDVKAAKLRLESDDVTGLKNRYAMQMHGPKKVELAYKTGTMLVVGILDLDHFKELNDTCGHLRGDTALKQVGNILDNCLDGYGDIYRYGGDEFVLIIPNGNYEVADKVARKIIKSIAKSHIPNKAAPINGELTISLGICCCIPKETDRLEDLFDIADGVLYQVKNNGKNNFGIKLIQESESCSV